MVDSRTTNPRILELAASIQTARGPEMDQIAALIEQWGQPTSDATSPVDSMDEMDHGGVDSGMMSQQQIAQLEGLRDGDFDTAWLKMMIEHHSGAIATAQSELSDGDNADAKQLATDIIAAQQSEITAMQALCNRTDPETGEWLGLSVEASLLVVRSDLPSDYLRPLRITVFVGAPHPLT